MDNKKTDIYYANKIVADIHFILSHTEGLSQTDLENDEVLLDSVMFRLIQISENSDKLSVNFKSAYGEIPWRAIKGMRNRLVHEYGNVDISIVYDAVVKDLPVLIKLLENIL
ncbi:MAG: DUF86 domain-containing protein [Clostridia bacterium]|nr:DUF86 domain-containing protein [Clostridia bacterium]